MNLQQQQQAAPDARPTQVVASVQPEPEEAPAEVWIERLTSRDSALRAAAEQRLARGDEATIQALIVVLERENAKKRLRFGVGTAIGILIIIAIQVAVATLVSGHVNVAGSAWLAAIGIGAAVAPTRLQKAVARVLSRQDEIRAVGPLCEALDRQDDQTKKLAAGALARLLPRLGARDGDLLAPNQRALLWKTLGKTSDPVLARGILNAAVQTGDGRAIASAERVARGKGPGRKSAEVRTLASEVMPEIRRRAEEEKVRMTLLRPAEIPDSEAALLLRPSQGVDAPNPDVLLRPAQPDSEPG